MTSLEGWGSAIELRPHVATPGSRGKTATRVAYRLRTGVWPVRAVRSGNTGRTGPPDLGPTACGPETVSYGWPTGMWRSLVSAPALGAGGRGFESRHPDQKRRS